MNPYSYDYNLSDWYGSLPGGAIACYWCLIAVSIAAMWILYNKAHEEGWAAIVPFYNTYVLFKLTWGSGWLFLLLLIPIANIVIYIITMVKLAQVFGKGGGFACGLIFLNTIFICIMAFDDKIQYVGINGEYARDYGPGSGNGSGYGPGGPGSYGPGAGYGGSFGSTPDGNPSQPGFQSPYGGAPRQDSYSQSAGNAQYYYKDTGAAQSAPQQPAPQQPTPEAQPAPQSAPEAQSAPQQTPPADAQPAVKFCTACGQKLEHGEKFCPKCGAKQ